MRIIVLLVGVLASATYQAEAQVLPPSGRASVREPDAVQSCLGCHGPLGAGVSAGDVPRIAGMSRYYLIKQLLSYANGTRRNQPMEEIARSMSPADIDYVSTYFAQVDASGVYGGSTAAPAGALELGRSLATVGSHELRVQACNNCHGPGGTGEPPAIPYLAGQGASYLIASMTAWRAGTRTNDEGDQMAMVARALTPDAIVAVARYYSGLNPPPPAPVDLIEPPRDPPLTGGGAVEPRPDISTVSEWAATGGAMSATDLSGSDPVRGRAILASGLHGCAACHAIPGVRGANGVAGPPLHGMAQRGFVAGQLPNRPDVLIAFLMNPPALVPGTGMPATGLTREEALDVAAYLYTLDR